MKKIHRQNFYKEVLHYNKLLAEWGCGRMWVDMTKTFLLENRDGVYCLRGQREREGKVIDWWEKMVCGEFVELALYGYHYHAPAMPSAIEVKVSDEPMEGGIRIGVMKGGYYRWHWRHLEEYYKFFSTWHGLYYDTEEILDGFFPDAREDGLDEEKCLWILIEAI